ncbi:hypothetical protein C8R44DRAFT_725787 [Mycena epipterygia]|nr:hypothetical protein C8R44DRAFT_725787 [Mycena epipterygia]
MVQTSHSSRKHNGWVDSDVHMKMAVYCAVPRNETSGIFRFLKPQDSYFSGIQFPQGRVRRKPSSTDLGTANLRMLLARRSSIAPLDEASDLNIPDSNNAGSPNSKLMDNKRKRRKCNQEPGSNSAKKRIIRCVLRKKLLVVGNSAIEEGIAEGKRITRTSSKADKPSQQKKLGAFPLLG